MTNDITIELRASNQLKDTEQSRLFKSTSRHGHAFIKAAIAQLTERIELMREAGDRMPRKPVYVAKLEGLESEVVALIVLVVCLDSLKAPVNKLTLATRVSQYLQQEIEYDTLDSLNPGLIEGIRKHRKASHRTRQGVEDAIKGGEFGSYVRDPWTSEVAHSVGLVLLESLANEGFIESVMVGRSAKFYWSADVQEWSVDTYERLLYLTPSYLPLTTKPSEYRESCQLGTKASEYLNHSYGSMFPPIPFRLGTNASSAKEPSTLSNGWNIEAADKLSQVPYEVNLPVWQVMNEMWKAGHKVGKLVSSRPIEIPPYPAGGTDEEVKAWKSAASKSHIENATSQGVRMYTFRQLAVIGGFAERELYFIWQADSRGRLYPVTSTLLNPQGHDLSKGLLKLHESQAKAIGATGWDALKIQAATHWGYDKVSLAKRIEWFDINLDLIQQVAADPIGNLPLWQGADSPWQFLAVCFEIDKALSLPDPLEYKSSYICHYDGKCSGAQHWAALLRDKGVGSAVGLTPSTSEQAPPDLYTEVLAALLTSLSTDQGPIGKWWWSLAEDGKVNRALAKKPTMTYLYGSTRTARVQQVMDWANDSGIKGVPDGDKDDDIFSRAVELEKVISDALTDRLSAAVVGMDWITKAGKAITKVSDTISWCSASGFEVSQAYRKLKGERLDIVSKALGLRIRNTQQVLTNTVDKSKQATALAPNYIHSMDSAHLVSVVCNADIPLSVIHDSFGCLPADTESMLSTIKAEWVKQYSPDRLAMLREQWLNRYPSANIPPLPTLGNLKSEDINHSTYAFCP